MRIDAAALAGVLCATGAAGFIATTSGCRSAPDRSPEVFEDEGVLRRWIALGTGCRSEWNKPGTITSTTLGAVIDRHGVRFDLSRFAHQSNDRPTAGLKQYIWDCKIRVAVEPPANRRVHGVAAATEIEASKSAAAAVEFAAVLSVRENTVDQVNHAWRKGDATEGRERVSLASADESLGRRPACGESVAVGFDYSWMVDLDDPQRDRASTQVAGDGTLTIEAQLEPCEPAAAATPPT